MNSANFFDVVRARRSVRRFVPEVISDEVVKEILDAGLLAPNSSNLQAWQFYRVGSRTSPETRKKINQAFLSQPAAVTAPEIIVAVARTATWRKNGQDLLLEIKKVQGEVPQSLKVYYKKIVPLVYSVGPLGIWGLIKKVVFWAVGFFRPLPRECTSRSDVKIWAVKSTALACENIMLAARALGLDSCPMEGMDSSRLRKVLKVPRDGVIVMGIALGHQAEGGVFGPQVRLGRERFIFEVNF